MKIRIGLALLLAVSLLAFAQPAQKKPAIAIVELSGNGLDSTALQALTNRLRAELFETGKYTVVERSEMESILKEQGFQQTGCTDAACAVQIGQLLNAQFIIVGAIDHVGRVFSVNIRMVNVGSGEISSSAKSDCADCTIEDVMLKEIRNAARKIAGVDMAGQADVVTEQNGRKLIKYKNYKGGETGTLMITVAHPDAQVFVDTILHGTGSMVINSVPVGKHKILIKSSKWEKYSKSVNVTYNETKQVNPAEGYRFYIEAGAGIVFPEYKNANTVTGMSGRTWTEGHSWNPVIYDYVLTWRDRKNCFQVTLGVSTFNFGSRSYTKDTIAFEENKWAANVFFGYYRTIFDIGNIVKTEIGLPVGLLAVDYSLSSPSVRYQSESEYMGGPGINVLIGHNTLFCKCSYIALLGIESQAFGFTNLAGLSLLYKI